MTPGRLLRPVLGATVSLLVVATALTGCSHDPYSSYCDTVKDKRTELSKILDAGGNDAFLTALPIFDRLRDDSPSDVHGAWQQIVTSIEALRDALAAAHVDPTTYDRDHPPAGMTAAQQDAIDAAAAQLNSAQTRQAFDEVQQEVRDVCSTPLLLV